MNCTICHLLTTNTDSVIYESDLWRVVLNPNQQYLGRLYLTLKSHRPALSELTEDEWREFTLLTKQLEQILTNLFNPTHFNWQCLLNDAIRDQESPHVHWHLIPRYKDAVIFDNQHFTDTAWPGKYTTDQPHCPAADTLAKLQRALQLPGHTPITNDIFH